MTAQTDPYQLVNLYGTPSTIAGGPPVFHPNISSIACALQQMLPQGNASATSFSCEDRSAYNGSSLSPLIYRLDALLLVLKTCVGRQCTHPWASLFPSGEVQSLADALNPKYDVFFEHGVERVRYTKCERGYIADSEKPTWTSAQAYPMFEEMAYS